MEDYSNPNKNKIILRHNVKKYGTRERTFDFFIYNIPELVLKSSTFWLIRFSNVWKKIKFSTFLTKLNLETFDVVDFQFVAGLIADANTKGIIDSLTYDSSGRTIHMEAWLPVKMGTMVTYTFAWPKDVDVTEFFPTDSEKKFGLAGGDGPGKDVEGGFTINDTFIRVSATGGNRSRSGARDHRKDHGDKVPSDLDDTKPVPNFIGKNITPGVEPSFTYIYGDHSVDATITEPDSEGTPIGTFPRKVLSGTGDTYSCEIYKNGLLKAPVIISVRQLQIEGAEVIPAGAWALVTQMKVDEGSEETTDEYTMQITVWL